MQPSASPLLNDRPQLIPSRVPIAGAAAGWIVAVVMTWFYWPPAWGKHAYPADPGEPGYEGLFVALPAVPLVLMYSIYLIRLELFRRRRKANEASFESAHERWVAQVAAHDRAEYQRVLRARVWFPVSPANGTARLDVFGGTQRGWSAMVTTMCASLLTAGGRALVLDFSKNHVANDLGSHASARGHSVRAFAFSDNTARTDNGAPDTWTPRTGADCLLHGLSGKEVAELVSAAVHSLRESVPNPGIGTRSSGLRSVAAVCAHLEFPLTFARIEAGLGVLRGTYDPHTQDLLSDNEFAHLTTYRHTSGGKRITTDELDLLAELTGLAAGRSSAAEPAAATFAPLWPPAELTIVANEVTDGRRKEFLDLLVFHRLLHDMRLQVTPVSYLGIRATVDPDVIVVAGVAGLGLSDLDALSRQARRLGVRLMLLIEHLREDLRDFLGGSGVTCFMRLADPHEAAIAAEFVGVGFKFVLSELTEQVGTSRGTSADVSDSGGGAVPTLIKNSFDPSPTPTAWGRSVSTGSSSAESKSTGWTARPVHEYRVEPPVVQNLPPTVFVMVESGSRGRRVVVADCDPSTVLRDGVALSPRRPLPNERRH
ncbi:hypothetical protein [Nocardia sp. NPDC057668]|uniref:hypothetical protein n=1 Tax=Nocardia sp. NPDC057668 TaxID=3346202 RepID=UPI0036733193